MNDETEKKPRYLGCGIAAVIGLPVLYVLSPPFALSFVIHMHEWFNIDVYQFVEAAYYPLDTLSDSSSTIGEFYHWYMEVFPDWFYGI